MKQGDRKTVLLEPSYEQAKAFFDAFMTSIQDAQTDADILATVQRHASCARFTSALMPRLCSEVAYGFLMRNGRLTPKVANESLRDAVRRAVAMPMPFAPPWVDASTKARQPFTFTVTTQNAWAWSRSSNKDNAQAWVETEVITTEKGEVVVRRGHALKQQKPVYIHRYWRFASMQDAIKDLQQLVVFTDETVLNGDLGGLV